MELGQSNSIKIPAPLLTHKSLSRATAPIPPSETPWPALLFYDSVVKYGIAIINNVL